MKKLILGAMVLLFAFSAMALDYPKSAVTIICPWAPGGGTDRMARFIAEELQKVYKVPFNVVNRTGGNGVTGHSAIASARPNGYTLGAVTHDITTLKWMGLTELTPDDFSYVGQVIVQYPALIVRNDSPYKTVKDLIDDIKKRPGELTLVGTAVAGAYDLMRLGVMKSQGLKPDDIKFIPSTGAAAAIVELMGGHCDFTSVAPGEAIGQIQSGDFRGLGISAPKRLAAFPDIPTLEEQGIDYIMASWAGIGGPKGIPQEILDDLTEKISVIMKSDACKDFMEKNGTTPGELLGEAYYKQAVQDAVDCRDIMEYAGYLKK